MNENQTTSEEITGDMSAVVSEVVAETAVTAEVAPTEVSTEVTDITPTVDVAEVMPAAPEAVA